MEIKYFFKKGTNPELFAEFKKFGYLQNKLRNDLLEAERELLKKIRESEEYKTVFGFCYNGGYGSFPEPKIEISRDYEPTVSMRLDIAGMAVVNHEKKAEIDPVCAAKKFDIFRFNEKTINLLLTSKILTDDEKREYLGLPPKDDGAKVAIDKISKGE